MCKASVKEHISQELIDMEIAGHKKMQAKHSVQVYATATQHPSCQKCKDIDDKQIFGHVWYVVHLRIITPFRISLDKAFPDYL